MEQVPEKYVKQSCKVNINDYITDDYINENKTEHN